MIRELVPQEQLAQEEVLDGKGKKKLKKARVEPSRDSTTSLLRSARREAVENKLREEAWLQR